MTPLPPRARRPRAFTLLELLLSLAMVAMVMLTLYLALTIGLKAREHASELVAPVRTAHIAMDLVRADLESVPPPTGVLSEMFVGQHSSGPVANSDADYVLFYTIGGGSSAALAAAGAGPGTGLNTFAGGVGGAGARGGGGTSGRGAAQNTDPFAEGIRRVELQLRTDVSPPALIRRVTRNLLTTGAEEAEEEVLCRNVRSFGLRYFDGTDWLTDWDSTTLGNVLPLAVELTLEIDNPRKGVAESVPYRVTRLVPLACGKLSDQASGGLQ